MTGTKTHASTWALIPLKSPERAKSRLAGVLSPEQRLRLFFELAKLGIRTLHATRGVDAVAVVTSSPGVAAFARSLDAIPILQSADFGMSAAFDLALRELQPMQPQRVLMVAGDLPLISSSALEEVVTTNAKPGVVIVPDRRHVGTNVLLCTPPHIVAPCFGGHSFERHLAAAAMAGVDARVLEIEALALDLDLPEDFDYLRLHCGDRAALLLEALHSIEPGARVREGDRCLAVAE